jgi:hypothetical protein
MLCLPVLISFRSYTQDLTAKNSFNFIKGSVELPVGVAFFALCPLALRDMRNLYQMNKDKTMKDRVFIVWANMLGVLIGIPATCAVAEVLARDGIENIIANF